MVPLVVLRSRFHHGDDADSDTGADVLPGDLQQADNFYRVGRHYDVRDILVLENLRAEFERR